MEGALIRGAVAEVRRAFLKKNETRIPNWKGRPLRLPVASFLAISSSVAQLCRGVFAGRFVGVLYTLRPRIRVSNSRLLPGRVHPANGLDIRGD